jgi:hypothetical protein
MPANKINFQTAQTQKFRATSLCQEDDHTISHIEEFGCSAVNVAQSNHGLGWSINRHCPHFLRVLGTNPPSAPYLPSLTDSVGVRLSPIRRVKAMKTQAWAWLTAGVVALGLNGFYQDGGAAWAHRIAERISDRSDFVVARASERADQFVAEARMAAGHEETASCRLSTALAQFQTKVAQTQTRFAQAKTARFDRMTAREEVQAARLEASQARAEAQVEARVNAQVARMRFEPAMFERIVVDPVKVRVVCPRVRVSVPAVRIPVVNIPRLPMIRIPAPVISEADSDTGPI